MPVHCTLTSIPLVLRALPPPPHTPPLITHPSPSPPWRSRDGRFHLSEHAGGLLGERAVRHPRVDEHSGEQ
eukprot:scaffold16761_cov142-Isochrysis_galbana.AAC.8